MGYMRFNYRSEAIGKYIDVSIVYPTDAYTAFGDADRPAPRISHGPNQRPAYAPGMKFQTVYLIHGGSDDDTLPYRYTNVERYAQDNHVMLVTPDISNSFGADTEYGVDYCLFLTEELPRVIQALFASSAKREDNFIVGFAMGGNVALSCAIRAPERYHTCVDLSGGIGYTLVTDTLRQELAGDHFRQHFYLHNATFGPAEALEGSRHDLDAIARKKKAEGVQLSQFILVAGSEEGFIRERLEGDAARLKELGYDVTYYLEEGYGHDMRLWDFWLQKLLNEVLPLKRAAVRED